MAQSCDYEQWLPTSPVQGGFAFDDAYSGDGSSVMLAANPSKRFVRPGFTPLGLVPSAYVGKALRARPTSAPAPPPRPVPASARRQERMRKPAHDEQRADRNRLPPVWLTRGTCRRMQCQPQLMRQRTRMIAWLWSPVELNWCPCLGPVCLIRALLLWPPTLWPIPVLKAQRRGSAPRPGH